MSAVAPLLPFEPICIPILSSSLGAVLAGVLKKKEARFFADQMLFFVVTGAGFLGTGNGYYDLYGNPCSCAAALLWL